MPKSLVTAVALLVIGGLCGLALTQTHQLTRAPIEDNRIRQAQALLSEMQTHLEHEDAKRLESRLKELDGNCTWLRQEQKKIEKALQTDWNQSFQRSNQDIIAEVERSARDRGAKLLRTLGASIDTWFLSGQSLEWLVQGQWLPLVKDYRQACLEAAEKSFSKSSAQIDNGCDIPEGVRELNRRAGIDNVCQST